MRPFRGIPGCQSLIARVIYWGELIEEGIELVVCSREELIEHITEGRLDHALNLAVVLLAILKGHLSIDLPRAV